MSSGHTSLNDLSKNIFPDADQFTIGIVVSEWNAEITEKLFDAAYQTLISCGVQSEKIIRANVPGSFELPLGAMMLMNNIKPDAIICLGCVIQGETRHFDFICSAASQGIMDLNLRFEIPFVFGVLTTDSNEQALERAGGKHGNKGEEAAISALKMIDLAFGFNQE